MVDVPTVPFPAHAPGFSVKFERGDEWSNDSSVDNPREILVDGDTIYFELNACAMECFDCTKGETHILNQLRWQNLPFKVVTFGRRGFGRDLWLMLPRQANYQDAVEQISRITGFKVGNSREEKPWIEIDNWIKARRPLWKKVFLFWKKYPRAWEVSCYDHEPWNKFKPE